MIKFNPLLKYNLDRSGAGAGAIGLFQGDWDVSGGLLPTTRTDGTPIVSGDSRMISVAGTITGLTPTADLTVGDSLISKADTPATVADWFSLQGNNPAQGEVINLNVSTVFEIISLIPNINDKLWVKETEESYFYEPNGSSYVVNGTSIFNTALGGDTRWVSTDTETRLTYAEAEIKINNSILIPGKGYVITDFVSKNKADDDGSIYISPITEPLVLKAATNTSFYPEVKSELFLNDIIDYNFNDNKITEYTWGERYTPDGGDQGEDTTISNITPTSFEINKEYDFNDYYYVYVWDGTNEYEYDETGYGVNFTVTDLGGGQFRYDILDLPLDITQPDGYVYVEGFGTIESRTGKITYRENKEKNIKTTFNFRHHGRKRYKADVSSYPAWDAITTWAFTNVVTYGGNLYIAMDENINETPSTSSRVWQVLIMYYANSHILSSAGVSQSGNTIQPDLATGIIYDNFSTYDTVTGAGTFSIDSISNVDLESYDIVCLMASGNVDGFKVGISVEYVTIMASIRSFDIFDNSSKVIVNRGASIQDNTTLGVFSNFILSGSVSFNTFYKNSSLALYGCSYSNIGTNHINCMYKALNGTTLGGNYTYTRIGYGYRSTRGDLANQTYFKQTRFDLLFGSINYVLQRSSQFYNNTFGTYFNNVIIEDGVYIYNNTMGNHFGGSTSGNIFTISGTFAENIGGNYLFSHANSTWNTFTFNTLQSNIYDLYFGTGNVSNNTFETNVYGIIGNGGSYMVFKTFAHNITYNIGNTCQFGINSASLVFSGSVIRAMNVDAGVQGITTGPLTDAILDDYDIKKITSGGGLKWLEYIDATGNTVRDNPTL